MGKEKSAAGGSLVQELFLQAGLYKRSQGRITRQVTFAVLAVIFALAAWRLWETMRVSTTFDSAGGLSSLRIILPLLVLVVGGWLSYRLVNVSRFADFLISVEAEMNKVSWPSRTELIRSSIVVIFVMFFLATLLSLYDVLWRMLFQAIGVIHGGG